MQKSGFPKLDHYVGFWQIGSHIFCQNKDLPGQMKFGWTNFLYIINGNFIEFVKNNELYPSFKNFGVILLEIMNYHTPVLKILSYPRFKNFGVFSLNKRQS